MLEFLKDPESLRKAILEKGGIDEAKLAEKVRRKQEEFCGLINEAAALYLIANELCVEPEFEKCEPYFTTLGGLSSGMQDVNVHAKIMRVLAPRKFEKNGRSGKVCSLVIGDSSGEATLVLWNKDVGLVEKGVIEKGDVVDVLGAYVKESGEMHLSIGGQVLKVSGRAKLPEVAGGRRIADIQEGMENVDFVAEVMEVGAVNSFQKGGRVKHVSSMVVADDSSEARLTLWDSNAELARKLRRGDRVKVENAYAKKGAFGKELHADWRSRVVVNPRNVKLQIKSDGVERRRIADLEEGMAAELEGNVVSSSAYEYDMCGKCGGGIQKGLCSKCGPAEAKREFVLNATLDDGSGRMEIVLFGRSAREFLGVKEIPEGVDAETIVGLKNGEIVGRKVVVEGNVRRNKLTGGLEFVVGRMI